MTTRNPESLARFKRVVRQITAFSHRYYEPDYFFHNGEEVRREERLRRLREIAHGIQLPIKAQEGVRFGKDLDQNPYRFLFINNPYLRLYEYLHSVDFRAYQTGELQLYMGLFSYIDRESQQFRYLISSQDLPSDRGQEPPHFYLPAFHYDERRRQYAPEQPEWLEHIMRSFYLSRKSERPSSIDFVRILRNSVEYEGKRTAFEREQDMIYIPSGEIDASLVCWLLLSQEEDLRRRVRDILASEDPVDVKWANLWAHRLTTDWKAINEVTFGDHHENIHYPYEGRRWPVIDWLKKFGLISFEGREQAPRFTERGRYMLQWFSIYLRSLREEKEKNLGPLLERIDKVRTKDLWLDISSVAFTFDLENRYQLKRTDFQNLVDHYLRLVAPDDRDHLDCHGRDILLSFLHILMLWDEKNDDKATRLKHFQNRTRFDLIGHFVMRYFERFHDDQPANSARGWIVFPVLRDVREDERIGAKYEQTDIVGFFLGAIKDSTETGEGYFPHLGTDDDVERIFREQIADIKTIIEILARVENRAIFYNGIKREAESLRMNSDNERMFAHANKYLFGAMAYDTGQAAERLRQSSFQTDKELKSILEELELKSSLISYNYRQREELTREEDVKGLKYKTVDLPLLAFFQYLFIVNHFTARKVAFRLNFNRSEYKQLSDLLKIEDFARLREMVGVINETFHRLFEENRIRIDAEPNLLIRVPTEHATAQAYFYFNFLALVNNFFKHWIAKEEKDIVYTFHVRFWPEKEQLFFLQSKEGDRYPPNLYSFGYYDDLKHYLLPGREFVWRQMRREKENFGIRHLKRFFLDFFNSTYVIMEHVVSKKEYRLGIKQEWNEYVVLQKCNNINGKLIQKSNEEISGAHNG